MGHFGTGIVQEYIQCQIGLNDRQLFWKANTCLYISGDTHNTYIQRRFLRVHSESCHVKIYSTNERLQITRFVFLSYTSLKEIATGAKNSNEPPTIWHFDKCRLCSVFVKRWQPAKIATYFAFCASHCDKLVNRLYYKAVNLARFMTMSAGYSKTQRNPCSYDPLQPPFKLRDSKWCSVSSLTIIEYSSN